MLALVVVLLIRFNLVFVGGSSENGLVEVGPVEVRENDAGPDEVVTLFSKSRHPA